MATLTAQTVPIPSLDAKPDANVNIDIIEDPRGRHPSSSTDGSVDSDIYGSSVSSFTSDAPAPVHREAKKVDGYTSYYPHPTTFKLGEHAIDDNRSLKVAVVGAGLSGLIAGALLPVKVPDIQLVIFDKNDDVGGTWHENRYPGVRCDIPSHVYQSSFSPNTQWSEEYATGPEIRKYWEDFATKHDVYSRLRLSTKVTGSYWEPQRAQWRVETNSKGVSSVEHFDFVIHAIGRFNSWKLPEYPGMDKYKGKLFHSSNYDDSFDPVGKRIATIGNGASGIQVTPALQKVAAHIDHYARSPTWIGGAFTPDLKERQDGPMYISPEDREAFKTEETYLRHRKRIEDGFYRTFGGIIAGSKTSNNLPEKFTNLMKTRLEKVGRADLLPILTPDFPPHCRRLTPGPGYLESLTKDNVTLIQTPIERFTEDGIVTKDGVHRPVDAVICSTGANTDCTPPIPIVAGDFDLSRDWKPAERSTESKFGFPYSYLGMGVPGFPNMSFILGPNPAGPTGTLVNSSETQVAYIAKMLRKISSQGIRTMVPSKAAADDFISYCDAYFPRTNLTKICASWSNSGIPGSRIHGHWPGSAAHLNQVRREPRWEDFEYTYMRPENRFAYWGNGWTKKEQDPNYDMTSYLKREKDNDLRDLHERWWDL